MHSDTCVTTALLSSLTVVVFIVASIIFLFVGVISGQLIRKCKQLQINKERTDGTQTSDSNSKSVRWQIDMPIKSYENIQAEVLNLLGIELV